MNEKKIEAVRNELKLIAKELYAAEEKKEFKDLDWREQDEAIRKARKMAGLQEEPNMMDNVSIYTNTPSSYQKKEYDIEISINWKAMGDKNLAETQKFSNELNEAIKKAKKLADVLKRNFPDVKLKGI